MKIGGSQPGGFKPQLNLNPKIAKIAEILQFFMFFVKKTKLSKRLNIPKYTKIYKDIPK